MNPLQTLKELQYEIDGYECTFTQKDDDFLASLGLKKITGLRDSIEPYPEETDLDRLQRLAGYTGCNDSATQDFVCEKDGMQIKIFVLYGYWAVGCDACYKGRLIEK